MANVLKPFSAVSFLVYRNAAVRLYASKVKNNRSPKPSKFDSTCESIASRGFLRSLKAYDPPANVGGTLASICAKHGVNAETDTVIIEDAAVRFSILTDCWNEFKHSVPNSSLHTIETVGDLVEFYNTKVESISPLDGMKSLDLPKNLHVQYEYHRFHPDTDTMFGGISAFPKSSTIVTGLKYKKKYSGYTAKTSWP